MSLWSSLVMAPTSYLCATNRPSLSSTLGDPLFDSLSLGDRHYPRLADQDRGLEGSSTPLVRGARILIVVFQLWSLPCFYSASSPPELIYLFFFDLDSNMIPIINFTFFNCELWHGLSVDEWHNLYSKGKKPWAREGASDLRVLCSVDA